LEGGSGADEGGPRSRVGRPRSPRLDGGRHRGRRRRIRRPVAGDRGTRLGLRDPGEEPLAELGRWLDRSNREDEVARDALERGDLLAAGRADGGMRPDRLLLGLGEAPGDVERRLLEVQYTGVRGPGWSE